MNYTPKEYMIFVLLKLELHPRPFAIETDRGRYHYY